MIEANGAKKPEPQTCVTAAIPSKHPKGKHFFQLLDLIGNKWNRTCENNLNCENTLNDVKCDD